MKRLFRDFSMRKRLYVFFLVCSLIPVIFIFALGFAAKYRDEMQQLDDAIEKRLSSTSYMMNKTIDENISKSEIISRSSIIINGLKENYEGDIGAVMSYYSDLDVFISGFDFQLINTNEKCRIYTFNKTLPMGKYIYPADVLEENGRVWTELEAATGADIIWDYSHAEGQYGYISFFRKILYYENSLGFMEVRLYIDDFTYPLQSLSATEERYHVICTSPDGTSLYSDGKEFSDVRGLQHTDILNDGSTISVSVSNQYLVDKYSKYIILYFIGVAVLIFILFRVYKKVISDVTGDLNEFIEVLRDNSLVDEDYFTNTSVSPEIALIKKKFKDLIDRNQEMNRNIIEIDRAKRMMELEFFQSRINPHLLYNSLNVIKWKMLRLDQKDIARLIDNMVDYYRQTISDGDYIITVEEELGLIDRYIEIVELSYDNAYRVVKDIDEDTLKCATIKLVLQPIVENAILHGIVDKEDGVLSIKVKRDDNKHIIFTITDNGYGMSEEDIKRALDINKPRRKKGGYGISNTIKRIKAYYGDECGITISSRIGEGTTVVVTILEMNREDLQKKL